MISVDQTLWDAVISIGEDPEVYIVDHMMNPTMGDTVLIWQAIASYTFDDFPMTVNIREITHMDATLDSDTTMDMVITDSRYDLELQSDTYDLEI